MLALKSSMLCVLLCTSFVVANANTIVDTVIKYEGITHEIRNAYIINSFMTILVSETFRSPRNYDVILKALDGTGETRECSYEVKDGDSKMIAYPIGSHRFLLLTSSTEGSEYEKIIGIAVYDTSNCEVTYEDSLEFDSYHDAIRSLRKNYGAILVNDDEHFDIFYDRYAGHELIKVGINLQSKVATSTNTSFLPLDGSFKIFKKGPSSSTFIIAELKLNKAYKISLVKPDGHVVLKEFKSYDGLQDHDVSSTDGIIRICSKTNTNKVDCEVFDDNGKSKSTVSVNVPHKVEIVSVQNLDDGKFLLYGANKKSGGALMKVNGDGSVIGVAKLPDFDSGSLLACESNVDIMDSQACVTRKCLDTFNVKVTKDCYGDSDFH